MASLLLHGLVLIAVLAAPNRGPWGTRWDAHLGTGRGATSTLVPLSLHSTPRLATDPAPEVHVESAGSVPDLSALETLLAQNLAATQPDAGAGTWRQALLDEVRWPDALLPEGHNGKVRVFWRRGAQGELLEWDARADPGLPAAFLGHVRSGLDRSVGDPEAAHRQGCWTVQFDAAEHRIELEVHPPGRAASAESCLGSAKARRR